MTRDDDTPAGQREPADHDHRADDGGEAADALVAEATRLADAFTSWVGGVGGTGDAGDRDGSEPVAEEPGEDSPPQPVGDEPAADGTAAPASMACDCGRTAGLDAICRVCPVCRIASYMQTVRPEVLVRVADVLAMVAGSLQMIAADRGSDPQASPSKASTNDPEDGAGRPDPRPADTGIPIPVRGDDDPTAPERH
ncbi:hypothetical protein [Allobranchiibius huperziae]|uniref:Uncharacterized protein n=1 Tax=Allobranchiibius huperziae TaxID=1874116 RepID=A0A853DCH2_9MICO|nr:hypothetical protein [Allobranchiibius huperziae]NYJ75042.1 hypothetical protein [Allobranchiibius huperziae]